jgi:hypothetical protein
LFEITTVQIMDGMQGVVVPAWAMEAMKVWMREAAAVVNE